MKEPSLQTTTILSLVVHLTFLFIALITMNQTNHFIMHYHIVRLVGYETVEADVPEKGNAATQKGIEAIQKGEAASQITPSLKASKGHKALKDASQYIADRIAAIEATKKAKNIVRLRNIIAIKGSGAAEEKTTEELQTMEGEDAGLDSDSYAKKIAREIWQHYIVIPEIKGRNLESIISVTVMQDGNIRITKIEKSSGNLLFDRSVLNAIKKASPVSQPPYEMEIEVRFTP